MLLKLLCVFLFIAIAFCQIPPAAQEEIKKLEKDNADSQTKIENIKKSLGTGIELIAAQAEESKYFNQMYVLEARIIQNNERIKVLQKQDASPTAQTPEERITEIDKRLVDVNKGLASSNRGLLGGGTLVGGLLGAPERASREAIDNELKLTKEKKELEKERNKLINQYQPEKSEDLQFLRSRVIELEKTLNNCKCEAAPK
ncbi:hypothetical protein BY458DRAFT_525984 [Sporodiniella umbellata]|nr:hypothetical protein BY458DRAFT_525984 [Sporodiniella umbellata]